MSLAHSTSPTTARSVPLRQWKENRHVCVCVHMHKTHNRFKISKINKNKNRKQQFEQKREGEDGDFCTVIK